MARKKKEDIIDLGSINAPTSWNEISLKKFQDIQSYYKDKDKDVDVRDVVHILCGVDKARLNELPAEFLDIILNKLSFLFEEPKAEEPKNSIIINDEKYFINFMEKLKVGEYVQVDSIIKQDNTNYAAILAVLCRKIDEKFDDDYVANHFDERVKMFESQPITKILPLVAFFLRLSMTLQAPSVLYMHLQQSIDLTAKSIKNSQKDGGIKALYMIWLRVRLWILVSWSKLILRLGSPTWYILKIKAKLMKWIISIKKIFAR